MFDEVEKKINSLEFRVKTLEKECRIIHNKQCKNASNIWKVVAVSFPAAYVIIQTILHLKGHF